VSIGSLSFRTGADALLMSAESFAESRRLMGEDLGEVEGWLIEEELEPPGLKAASQDDIKALVEVDACPVAAQGEEMSSSFGLLVSPAVCETSDTPDTAVDRIKEEPGQRRSTTDSPPSRTIDSIDLTADSPPSSPPAPSWTPSSPPILPTIPNIPSTSLTSAIPRTPLPRDSPPRRTRKAFDDLKAEYPPVLRIKFNDLDPRTTSQDLVDLVQATVPPDSFRNTYVHFLPSGDLYRLPISFGFVDFTCVDAAHKLLDFYRGATACPLSSKERGTFKVHQVPCPRFLLTHLPYALEAKGALQGLLRFEIGARGNIRYVRDRDGEVGAIINILTDRDASQVEQYLRKHPEVVMEMEWERLGELGGTAPGPGRDRTGSNSIEVVRTSLKRESGGGEEQERNGLGMGRVDGRRWRDKWTRSP
jgi:hypothetical protein